MTPKFTIIGIPDSLQLTPDVTQLISRAQVLSGGKRHHQLASQLIAPDAQWIDITVPLSNVFDRYREQREIVVLASGDPLFFGFAATLQREFPGAEMEVIPWFNSLQTLAHRLALPYQTMTNVSVTGRPWKNLDDALIRGDALIGVLTDRNHTPDEAARRMIEYGYTCYRISIGEQLGNTEAECVSTMSLSEAAARQFSTPNCFILQLTTPRHIPDGIPASEFHHLDGRANMITKMPIRLLSLAMLDLAVKSRLWDVGFCTGSVSIEARRRYPHLQITAFERRPESARLMEMNCRRFGAPDIDYRITDFMTADLDTLPRPDAVFIGGHGGRLDEMVTRIFNRLAEGGTVVFNSVNDDSCATFCRAVEAAGHKVVQSHRIALDSFNPITIIKAQ